MNRDEIIARLAPIYREAVNQCLELSEDLEQLWEEDWPGIQEKRTHMERKFFNQLHIWEGMETIVKALDLDPLDLLSTPSHAGKANNKGGKF